MKVGYLCYAGLLKAGGPGLRTADLLSAFAQLGHEVHIRTESAPDTLKVVRHLADPAGLAQMAKAIDVCLVRLDGSCHAERLAEEMLTVRPNLPIVLEIHSPLEEQRQYPVAGEQERHAREQWIERGNAIRRSLVARGATCVCGAREMERYARQTLGASRTLFSPNSANIERFSPTINHDGPFTALWTGSAKYKWQAVDLVLEAARLAPEIRFLVVSATPDGVPQNLPPNIETVFGASPADMALLYAQANVALVLYHQLQSEWGFYLSPLKLYEALAAGVAIIGSDMGQIAEVVSEADCGLLVCDDPHEIVHLLRRLAADPQQAATMGRAARRRAESRTWLHAATEIVRFCEAIAMNTNQTG